MSGRPLAFFVDYLSRIRDRWLASPRFQLWASAFPLTRPIARHRTKALFDVVAGFVYSQVLFACVRVRLFERLGEGPLSGADLAEALALPVPATQRLLGAAAALRLVERRGRDRWGLGALGAAVLGNPGVAAMVEHHALLYEDLRDPIALLRSASADTHLAKYWAYTRSPAPATVQGADVAAYSALMAISQPMIADAVLDAYPLRRHRCLMDVGGGTGSFLIACGRRYSHLQMILFDLPAVAEAAQRQLTGAGLSARSRTAGGDFLKDRLPHGADVISLIRVLHDHDDDVVLRILAAVHDALPEHGTLLIGEPMSGTAGPAPVADAYFGFYLWAMGRGRVRTRAELAALLARSGFAPPRLCATPIPLLTRVLVATLSRNNC